MPNPTANSATAPPKDATTASATLGALLFLHAQTSLHPGTGAALGVVDLPVSRERHTQWPNIPGTSLKGVLRDACREQAKTKYEPEYEEVDSQKKVKRTQRQVTNEDDEDLVTAFGPGKVESNTGFAGALSFTDARILAFPVRSLKGVFAWVTCPGVLERLDRDLRLGQLVNPLKFDSPGENSAHCVNDSPLLLNGNTLVLEEFEFTRTGDVTGLHTWIDSQPVADQATQERLKKHLVVLRDDDFTHFVRHATEIVARVGLDYERKTVRRGALFYEEFLPAETLLYSVVLANSSRSNGQSKTAPELLKYLKENCPPFLQIGAGETVGKGWCAVNFSKEKASKS